MDHQKNQNLEQARSNGIAPWDDLKIDLGTVKVYADRYPVTVGHRLFIPEQNTVENITECFQQAYKLGQALVRNGACDGFNIGMNLGASAGQTVMYPHVHMIPRRSGDCQDPTGGVRGVIPGQANYRKDGYKIPNRIATPDPSDK